MVYFFLYSFFLFFWEFLYLFLFQLLSFWRRIVEEKRGLCSMNFSRLRYVAKGLLFVFSPLFSCFFFFFQGFFRSTTLLVVRRFFFESLGKVFWNPCFLSSFIRGSRRWKFPFPFYGFSSLLSRNSPSSVKYTFMIEVGSLEKGGVREEKVTMLAWWDRVEGKEWMTEEQILNVTYRRPSQEKREPAPEETRRVC